MANADDREEGEIEDGEIIESGEEGGFDPENEKMDNNNGSHSMMELLYMEMEGKDESNVKKRKKKRKRKKKASTSNELNPPKLKKPRYVDHDRIVEKSDNSLWHKSFPSSPPHASVPHPVPPTEEGRRFYNNWSPDRQSPDENNPRSKRPREKSPPGLYDSPYESGDDLNDGSGGNFDREFPGRPGGNRKNRKRKMRSDKRGGTKRRNENDTRRRNQRAPTTDTQHLICKFYLEGKCVKGDGCNYSHDISNKKMELCKFYLNGFCSKIESCIYLHNEFPCKFFHTGAECYSAENCKFSHDPLSDAMRKALDIHLAKDNKPASSPRSDGECTIQPRPHRPSLLGSPPQHIKDMVMRKKIPSLFDLEIKPPVYQAGVGTSNPPVPQGSQNSQGPPSINPSAIPGPLLPTPNDFRPNFRDDGHRAPLLPLPPSSFEPDSQDFYNFDQDLRVPFNSMDPNFSNGPQSSFNPPKRYFGSDSMMDVDERYPSNGPNNTDPDNLYMNNNFDEDERVHEVIKNHEHGNPADNQPFNPIPWRNLAVLDVDMRAGMKDDENSDSSSGNIRDFYSKFGKTNNDSNEEPFGVGLDTSLSSESEDESKRSSKENSRSSNVVPLHLPKKQRELFMRIQQREAANKTVSDSEDSKKAEDCTGNENGPSNPTNDSIPIPTEVDEEIEKEKWYSSSEDDDDDNDQPLAAMLKKLQQQPIGKTSSSAPASSSSFPLPSSSTPSVTVNDSSMLQLSKILQSIANKPSVAAPASTPAVKKADPRRDPRRDPRSSRAVTVPPPPPIATTTPAPPPPVTSEVRDPRSRQRPPPVTQPPLPVQVPQPSYAVNSSSVSYGDNSPSQIPSRLEETIPPQPLKSSLSRPPEHSKPKPIISRKRSSASEEEIVESHSKSSSHHLFPYKLHSVSVSLPNYSGVVHSVNKAVDPKLLLCDPRLKKELANEFSVLSGANEESSTSSLSLKKNEVSEPQNGSSHVLPAAVSKVRVGQHRLGVATMPAPRMKIQSSQLKKSSSGMLVTPLSLLREPPERSTTPPSILFGSRLKEPLGLGANSKVEKDFGYPNKHSPSEEETQPKASEKESEVQAERVIEITSILSPNAETVSNKFEDKVKMNEPEGVEESFEMENLKEIKAVDSSLTSIEVNKFEAIGINKVEAIEKKVENKSELNDSKMYDCMSSFNMDDSENEKSDSDLVIVEPEVEKVKKVKKSKVNKKSSSKSTSSSGADKNKKAANVLVAQLGDGTCIKIKIKPTPADADDNDSKKKETTRAPLKSKSSSSSSDNGKRATRNNKLNSISSFENALNAGSSPEQKPSKKTKKSQKEKEEDKEKISKKDSTSKSKSKKSKKQENGDTSMAEVKTD